MRLLQATLRPARVLENLGHGNIKVEAPGLFSAEDQENLPQVMPFFGLHSNTYSEPKVDDEVWVLNVTDNPLQLFWFRKDDRSEHNNNLEEEENVEIICNREAGTGYATIYFSDGTGWMFRNGDSFINIKKDGSILLDIGTGHRQVHICSDSISLGSEGGSAHSACFGDEVQNVLNLIQSCLATIKMAASTNPYTIAIANALGGQPDRIGQAIPKIVSQNVTLD